MKERMVVVDNGGPGVERMWRRFDQNTPYIYMKFWNNLKRLLKKTKKVGQHIEKREEISHTVDKLLKSVCKTMVVAKI